MSRLWCSAIAGGVRLAVQVAPNAKKSEVMALLDDSVKIRLQAPPLDGRANEELIRFLAQQLGVAKSAVTLTHGHTNKRKLLEIRGAHLSVESASANLLAQLAESPAPQAKVKGKTNTPDNRTL